MERINDDKLDERINTEWNELYPGIFAEASRYVPRVSQNRKEDGENALHTTVERKLERMWLQHYGNEIRHLFFEEQYSLTRIRRHLAGTYEFRISEKRLKHFLRPSKKPPKQERKDCSECTPGERKAYVVRGIYKNSLQWLRPYWRTPAEIWSEKDADATAHNPAEEMERAETQWIVRDAIQQLPEGQKEVMELIMEEYAREEITEKLDISDGALRKRRYDAGENLKDILPAKDVMP